MGATGAIRCHRRGAQVPPRATGAADSGCRVLPSGEPMPDTMLRVIRLAVSAARADGALGPQERELILARAREAGLESVVEAELAAARPLAEIVAGITNPDSEEGSLRARLHDRPRR